MIFITIFFLVCFTARAVVGPEAVMATGSWTGPGAGVAGDGAGAAADGAAAAAGVSGVALGDGERFSPLAR